MLKSSPEYTKHHSGTVIVAGSAPDVYHEYTIAANARPGAKTAVLNFMAGRIAADFIVTAHLQYALAFESRQRGKFATPAEIHGAKSNFSPDFVIPFEVYQWDGLQQARGGTSSLVAAMLMQHLGFDEVIMAGCPLEKVGYLDGYCESVTKLHHRELDPETGYRAALESWQERWTKAKRAGLIDNVRSMSGFTGRLCGGI